MYGIITTARIHDCPGSNPNSHYSTVIHCVIGSPVIFQHVIEHGDDHLTLYTLRPNVLLYSTGTRVPLFHQQGTGSVLTLAPNYFISMANKLVRNLKSCFPVCEL